MVSVKWISLTLARLGKRRDVVSAFFHLALCCRMVQHLDAALAWLLVLTVVSVIVMHLASAAASEDVIYSAAAFLAISSYDHSCRTCTGSGLQELNLLLTSNILLAELMLICTGTRPSVLAAWAAALSCMLCWRNVQPESAMLVWYGLGIYILSGNNSSQIKVAEESPHLLLNRCLGLVLRRIRVPLQLAQSDLEGGGNVTDRMRVRLQQIRDLLAGFDNMLSKEFETAVAKELGLKSDALSPLGHADKALRASSEDHDMDMTVPGHDHREGSPESSTTVGSGTSWEPGRWECLPEELSLQLTVDLEGNGMPVTEVKLCMDGQTPLDSFLPSESDWEEFRSWFEPEVNRAIHLDSYTPDSTAIPLVLPFLGDWHRLNAGKLQIACVEMDQHSSRFILEASQLTT